MRPLALTSAVARSVGGAYGRACRPPGNTGPHKGDPQPTYSTRRYARPSSSSVASVAAVCGYRFSLAIAPNGGGPSISMPLCRAAAFIRSMSGGPGGGNSGVSAVTPAARKNRSCPPGTLRTRNRALSETTLNACGTPRGSTTVSPETAVCSSLAT
jgi:hypothetical protein